MLPIVVDGNTARLFNFVFMQISTGNMIYGTDLLAGSIFGQSIIHITEMDEQGATGFMVNKLFPKTLNELVEFSSSPAFPLYNGGPVETEKLFFIHRRPDLIEDGKHIGNGIYVGGNFWQAVECINDGLVDGSHIKLFIGYCGWDAGELEAEVEEGSWEVVNMTSDSIFA